MEIIRLALDRGVVLVHRASSSRSRCPASPTAAARCRRLTLVPRPLYPYEIWQAVTSPPTLEYVPVVGHGAVFWNQHHSVHQALLGHLRRALRRRPRRPRAEPRREADARRLVRIEDTHEKAVETATPGHDEFWKFLGPYGWSRGYMGADGKPANPGLIPTLDESIENKTILLGTPEEVAEGVAFYRDLLGLEHLTIFPHLLGDPYKKADEQMARFARRVSPSSPDPFLNAPRLPLSGESVHRLPITENQMRRLSWQTGHQYSLRPPSTAWRAASRPERARLARPPDT